MSDLERLLAVQDIDTSCDQLRHRLSHLPERAALDEATAAADAVARAMAEADGQRAEMTAAQDKLEAEIGNLEERARQVSRALSTGTVPRELQALQDDLDGLQRRQRHLEDQVLEIMEAAEPVDANLAAMTAERAVHDERAIGLLAEVAEAEVAIEAELARQTEARVGAVTAVPAELLAEYDRLRQRLGGVAVARLVGGACQGCHLSLPAMEVDRIKHLEPEAMVHCDECGRLLVH